ncbi:MAG: LptF/LptG family permease [candidate division WOR-3 bacterium]
MKIFDRYLVSEFLKFLVLALLALVTIYVLIDLFSELDYYLNRHTPFFTVIKYYFFYIPSGISLLFPSAVICACFLVYGRLIREQSILVLESAGISIYRLLMPLVTLGTVFVLLQFTFYEFITIPCNQILNSIRIYEIERQAQLIKSRRYNLFVRDLERTMYYIKEYQADLLGKKITQAEMRDFVIINFAQDGTIIRRADGAVARYVNHQWIGQEVVIRNFEGEKQETYEYYPEMALPITQKPDFFLEELHNIEELQIWNLFRCLAELKRSGSHPAKVELELHFRFANAIAVFIIIVFSLFLAILIRKTGIMFGLALGLLFAFLYWGLIQVSKAYGQILVLSPPIAAWLINIIFIICDIILLWKVKNVV